MYKSLLLVSIGLKFMRSPLSILTIIVAFSGVLTANNGTAQGIDEKKVTIQFEGISLPKALALLEEQTGFRFVFNHDHFHTSQRVTGTFSDKTVADVLGSILTAQDKFTQMGDNVVIVREGGGRKASGWGVIQGTVVDSDTGEPLIGATVRIEGTTIGTVTNLSGDYRLEQLQSGSYSLRFSYIGYSPFQVADVFVREKENVTVDAALKPSAQELSDVVVEGKIDLGEAEVHHSTERSIIEEFKSLDMIATGISSEQINRSLDFSAAEVVQRAPGVTVVDEFINIRGMNERYNLVFLDGMIAPSSESNKRAFSFELIPSSVIDKIVIYRSPAPELPADFAGGLVKIHTKKSTLARRLEIGASTQYREGTTFSEGYGYGGNGDWDWLGFDDGTRSLPENFEFPRINPGRDYEFTQITPQDVADNVEQARRLNPNWDLTQPSFDPDMRLTFNYYDSRKIGSIRVNNLTSGFYARTNQSLERSAQLGNPGSYRYLLDESYNLRQARLGGMQNFSFKIDDRTFIDFNNLFNNLGNDRVIVRSGFDQSVPGSTIETTTRLVQFFWRQRLLYNGQINVSRVFGSEATALHELKVGGGYSYFREKLPGQRQFQVTQLRDQQDGDNTVFIVDESGGEGFEYNLQNDQKTDEETYTCFADYEMVLPELAGGSLPKGFKVKTGFFAELKKRDFENRFITLRPGPAYGYEFDTDLLSGPSREFVISQVFAPDNFRLDGSGFVIREENSAGSSFQAESENYAGYIGIGLPPLINGRLQIYSGVRYEWNQLKLDPRPQFGYQDQDSVNLTTKYWLPSANLQYRLSEKTFLRLAYGKTLNRPQFREISEFLYFDFDLNANVEGNPNLVTAEIHNFDFRWEYYPGPGEWITAGLFYKDLKNPIERVSISSNSSVRDNLTYANTLGAEVYGVELEFRKSLAFVPSRVFRHISAIANFAWLENQVSIDISDIPFLSDLVESERPLQGTANYVINTSLYYDNLSTGTSINLQYNRFGQRLYAAANNALPNEYERPRNMMDINFKQRLARNWEVKAGVKNLFNARFSFYRDHVVDGEYHPDDWREEGDADLHNQPPGADYENLGYREGRYFSMGILYIIR